jgi:alpha-N-arabinofuranosidase
MSTRLRGTPSVTARFRNPVLAGCHPDPSICRVGADFYLVTSSFEYFPGVPIFRSRDLVHWQPIGHVLRRRSQLDLRGVPSSRGIYAPTLRYSRGRFYVVTTHVGGGGNFFVSARRPEGPWSDPVWLDPHGIDPSFLFDGESVYFTRNGKGADFDHPVIYQARVDLAAGRLRGKLRRIWSGTGGVWPEAPHLCKVGRLYYLITAEGGTSYGHSVVVARSVTPFGPFEPSPRNPVLTHRDRPRHPIQATGHADFVELPDGTWWCVFLGIRPSRGRHHHLGRETFLAPVTWGRDGWPVIGDRGRVEFEMHAPALPSAPVALPSPRDDFDARTLATAWNFVRNPDPRDWSLTARAGFLRLRGSPVTLDDVGSPALVARRQQHFAVRCRAALEFYPKEPDEEAGMTVRANESFRYDLAIRRRNGRREAVLRERLRGRSRIVAGRWLGEGRIELAIEATRSQYVFRAGAGEGTLPVGKLETAALSAESIGAAGPMCFTGVYIGLYATGHGRRCSVPADFDWFEYIACVPGVR